MLSCPRSPTQEKNCATGWIKFTRWTYCLLGYDSQQIVDRQFECLFITVNKPKNTANTKMTDFMLRSKVFMMYSCRLKNWAGGPRPPSKWLSPMRYSRKSDHFVDFQITVLGGQAGGPCRSQPVAVGRRRSFTLFVVRVQANTRDALMYSRTVAAFLKRVMSTVFFREPYFPQRDKSQLINRFSWNLAHL